MNSTVPLKYVIKSLAELSLAPLLQIRKEESRVIIVNIEAQLNNSL